MENSGLFQNKAKSNKIVQTTSHKRLIDVETTSCVYWEKIYNFSGNLKYNEKSLQKLKISTLDASF